MTGPTRAQYADALRDLPATDVPAYLTAHSNLPGPRSNLTLLDAAADVLPHDLALRLADDPDEYLACCGVATLGRLALDDPTDDTPAALLTARASDDRWRVREAVAIAAQRIGDDDPVRMRTLVGTWVASDDPLVVRAAIAAICEPRLLRDPVMTRAALDACSWATATLLTVPPEHRRDSAVRVLRQGLGYCWSVAVAADPEAGLPLFAALPTDDPDIAWVARTNRTKKRLAVLLDPA